MLPRWHVLLGAIFTLLLWIASPGISLFYLALVFLASIFIDLDHYLVAVHKNKSASLPQALDYYKEQQKLEIKLHKKGIRTKGHFFLFHTLEFHLLIAVLGVFFTPFFYIFLGMLFHSLLDVLDMLQKGRIYRREFFLTSWILTKF